ncbi:hypothetical protein CF319_g5645 [Tilletia indica]|uniref:Peroxisomal membrane protein 4 n=2 Tax=Tilletia TaxID=13289 RepID=A0A8X7N9E1_9BASI|nr:hypothetical protein CF327_g5264 [Tilletia walkeri]KAE8220902.1 hypothetical protein CF319_g5645 [Tilletia indica]KAE8230898.1 hypothetical protein CF326_g4097 [Tilletia indica]KAE8254012.1 hypothetical protein A4X13_0g3574 [Tilletia indica]KAE8268050.1 hypothetical protein A4X09_0g4299 [Tilletia walkeri]
MSGTVDYVRQQLEAIALDPRYKDPLIVLKAARNGLVYGAKIRFPHAVVMSVLFGRGSWKDRIQFIITATRTHAFALAKFASLYKLLLIIISRAHGGKERPLDSALAGLVGGWVTFRNRSSINEQIILYATGRDIMSLLPRADVPKEKYPPGRPRPVDPIAFEIFAAVSWAFAMWTHANRREALNGGMVSSMDYLYHNANRWDSLRNLFWHNT